MIRTFGVVLVVFSMWASSADAAPTVVAESQQNIGVLKRTQYTVALSANPIDRFFVYRLRRAFGPTHGEIILLPTLTSGFSTYELGENGDPMRSYAALLALAGYDVWATSQRVEGIPAGTCEGGADCSVMANWGAQAVIDDGRFALQMLRQAHPGAKPVVGGFSLGSAAGIATINQYPNDYAGLLAIEGTFYDEDPQVRTANAAFCAGEEAALAAGVWYDGVNLPGTKIMASLARSAPNAPSPLPPFAGLTNRQGFIAAFTTPNITPSTPRYDYYMLKGGLPQNGFDYADEDLFIDVLLSFPDYVSTKMMRDMNCSIAGERTLTNNLGKFKGKVFIAGGGHGFGPAMLATRSLMKKADVTTIWQPSFGHADFTFAEANEWVVEIPSLLWLASVFH